MPKDYPQVEEVVHKPKRRLEEVRILKRILISEINMGGRIRVDKGTPKEWEDFKENLKTRGQIHSIAVRILPEVLKDGSKYMLLAGGRRMTALEELGEIEIDATIYPEDLDTLEIQCIEYEENVKRLDLSETEKAKARYRMHDTWVRMYGKKTSSAPGAQGQSLRDSARMLGVSPATLSQDIKLVNIIEKVPELEKKIKGRKEALKLIDEAEKAVAHRKRVEEIEKQESNTTLSKVREMISNNYIVKPFLEGIKGIKNSTIDLINFDPDYPMDIEEDDPTHISQNTNVSLGHYEKVKKEDFDKLVPLWLQECYRVLKPDSWIIVWFGYEYFYQYQLWLTQAGFEVNWNHGKWYKGVGHTRVPKRYLPHTIEPFFYARKGKAQIEYPHTDVYQHSPVHHSKKINAYEKPVGLMEEIFSTFIPIGSRVLSAFAGSGNDGLAASNLSCAWLGFDVVQAQKDGFTVKVYEGEPKHYK